MVEVAVTIPGGYSSPIQLVGMRTDDLKSHRSDSSDSCSEEVTSSASDVACEEDVKEGDQKFLCNSASLVWHRAKAWVSGMQVNRCFSLGDERWANTCGTIVGKCSDHYFLSDFEPEGYEPCGKLGCRK